MTTLSKTLSQLESIVKLAAMTELMPRFKQIEREFKADGSIVTEADIAMQHSLMTSLKSHWPEIPVLGEEMTEAEQEALIDSNPDDLWIVDPLDGTSNFAAQIPCFSVSIGLMKNKQIILALIYDPNNDECFTAIKNEGAWINGVTLKPEANQLPINKCIAQIDFKRLPSQMAAQIASDQPYASQRSFGSGTLDWCWVAAGRVNLYLHGRQKLWDYCAGQLILTEAGGNCCTLDEEPVFRGKLETRSIIAASDDNHFTEWRDYILNINKHITP